MSTRNTVSCVGQGQAAGTAAALGALKGIADVRELPYDVLRADCILTVLTNITSIDDGEVYCVDSATVKPKAGLLLDLAG